jgi:hypothetical protein
MLSFELSFLIISLSLAAFIKIFFGNFLLRFSGKNVPQVVVMEIE